jgi:hypothetical protein
MKKAKFSGLSFLRTDIIVTSVIKGGRDTEIVTRNF